MREHHEGFLSRKPPPSHVRPDLRRVAVEYTPPLLSWLELSLKFGACTGVRPNAVGIIQPSVPTLELFL